MKIEKVYQSKTGEELQKWQQYHWKINIKLYSSELFCALLKASNYKLDERIAQIVAEGYARNLDYSDPELMHVGVTSVANNLLIKIKQEYFNVQYFEKSHLKRNNTLGGFYRSKVQARKTRNNAPFLVRFAFLCYNGFIKIKEFAMIGKNIKSLRKTHDLTQPEFARIIGILEIA